MSDLHALLKQYEQADTSLKLVVNSANIGNPEKTEIVELLGRAKILFEKFNDPKDVVAKCSAEAPDMVNAPPHYRWHPSGFECIDITRHCSFAVGNAIKYLWRSSHKNGYEDLKKCLFYINDEIDRRNKLSKMERSFLAVIEKMWEIIAPHFFFWGRVFGLALPHPRTGPARSGLCRR